MYRDLHCQYYWSKTERHIGDFFRRCLTCQQVKAEHQKLVGLLQPLEVAEWKWEHITIDFVTHLPRTPRRHDAIWVIVDRFTKEAHFLAVRMTFTLELSVVYSRDCPTTWRTSVHSIGQGSQVYSTLHRDTVDDEHCVSSVDRWSVGDDHTDFRGHAVSMRPVS